MTTTPDLDIDLADLAADAWLDRLDEIGEEHGYLERLGRDHAALFVDAGRDLLVTFETGEAARKQPGGQPRGFELVARNGWSLLSVIAEGETWFRARELYGFIDRLTDDGFFEDFDRVLFFGVHAGGYGAGAFSVAAPGARVLMLRPAATLDPAVAGWDRRYRRLRRLDFTTRYGYAPEMVDAADAAWVVHDPGYAPDAMHAALFRRPNVTALRTPLAGVRVDQFLDLMQVTAPLIEEAMEGALDRASFGRLWRARRDSPVYLRTLLKRLEQDGRSDLAVRLCRHGLSTRDRALFARKLEELTGQPAPPAAAE